MQALAGMAGKGSDRIRELAPSEFLFAASAVYVGYASLCAGELDLTELDNAFTELKHQHPELRSILRGTGSAFEFVAAANLSARVRVFPGEDPHTQATGRGALFEQTELLAYLDVLPGQTTPASRYSSTIPQPMLITPSTSSKSSGIGTPAASKPVSPGPYALRLSRNRSSTTSPPASIQAQDL